ncbi:hydroxymethylbilane synthase [Pseudobacteriovorax antillogorgiicola]|uniref:Hydroxymethylbilane synthase n=1 Tax=Pseudobacteriovorax antillogorgiicola TaxID=1513793 RepID=A0A1Y6B664_9BACT|nr:hydroxymethylbilane synthase [Pseudobacteriovorax antillogorgiicola]TCS58827.1 hydroxymethylbilane synthase [Pseudobacteriovorax antillogorgiicola]SME94224.1 hydroxymethylbilane synthase [Pseudobacteriovorax antillogorgiicola]
MTELIKIATRGSKLALWQANFVSSLLQDLGLKTELKIIKTHGDRVQDRFLHEMGGKGVFVKELEQAMLDGEVDIAVHSLKDLPAVTPAPFALPAILKRHNPCDAIVFKPESFSRFDIKDQVLSKDHFQDMGPVTIATSSLRRQSLFRGTSPDIKLEAVRGNVDTRLRKLMEGDWDALILAAASLERLNIVDVHHCFIDPEWYVPCAAQGALAIECREDHPLINQIGKLKDPITHRCATLERKILERLGGDCTMPFGAHISSMMNATVVRSLVLDYKGNEARSYQTYDKNILDLNGEMIVDEAVAGLTKMGLEPILKAIEVEVPDLGTLT